MSSAFVREGVGVPRIWATEEGAQSGAELYRSIDGQSWDYQVRPRSRGGFMVARLSKTGEFESWVEE